MTTHDPSSQPRRRRWLRYSLRTMLVIVFVLSVWLGWHANRAARQRRAVEALRAAGAEVFYDYHLQGRDVMDPDEEAEPPGWAWLRNLVGVDFYAEANLVFVESWDDDKDSDDVLRQLENIPRLRSLAIMPERIDTNSIARISRLASLEELAIVFTECDVVDFGALVELRQLRYLCVWFFNDDTLPGKFEWVGKLHDLEELQLIGPTVHDEDFAQMRELSKLKVLYLLPTEISNDGLAHLESFPVLEDLELESNEISDEGVEALGSLQNLKFLHLTGTQISDEGFCELQTALPKTVITH